MAKVKIHKSWEAVLKNEFEKEYFDDLIGFVKKELSENTVYPEGSNIFRAFDTCHFDDVKVVILGQDPYHGPGQANGLSFSVADDIPLPPSLRNIYKEIEEDTGKKMPKNGNLERWSNQGVLLLNATLTVRAHEAGSHQNIGWEEFTDEVIKQLSEKRDNLVFLLWGSYAQKKGQIIDSEKHFILNAPHPSPLSAHRGFFGSNHFTQTNKFLILNDIEPIDW